MEKRKRMTCLRFNFFYFFMFYSTLVIKSKIFLIEALIHLYKLAIIYINLYDDNIRTNNNKIEGNPSAGVLEIKELLNNGEKLNRSGANIMSSNESETILTYKIVLLVFNGCDTRNNTINDVKVADRTIKVDISLPPVRSPRGASNAYIIKLLIITTIAPGSAALMMLGRNLPLTLLLLYSRASANEGIAITK